MCWKSLFEQRKFLFKEKHSCIAVDGETMYKVVLLGLLLGIQELQATSDAMKYLASGFIRVLDECKHELNQSDHLLSDLYHFWKMEYATLTRDTGCAIICMSKKLDLMDEQGMMHHGNAQEFAVKHGADPDLASKLVTTIHDCEQQHTATSDDCSRVLEVAKCFRTGIKELHWSPKIDVIVTEVLEEI